MSNQLDIKYILVVISTYVDTSIYLGLLMNRLTLGISYSEIRPLGCINLVTVAI